MKHYYIQITGDGGVMSAAVKCLNLDKAKDYAKGMAAIMDTPRTLTIHDDQTIDRTKLYEYVKRD
jgi:hypothetical protein